MSDDVYGDALAARASGADADADPYGAALAARAAGEKFDGPKKLPTAEYASATEGVPGFIQGVAELGGKTALGIPHAAASGALDIARTLRIPGTDAPGSPEPSWMEWLRPEMSSNARNVAESIDSNPVLATIGAPVSATIDAAKSNFPTASRLTEDALSLFPIVGPKALKSVSEIGKAAPSAEEVVANTAARQSGGAAGAAPNLANASPQLKTAISEAARKTGGAVNPDALNAHLDADEHGVQLMKGQATRDPDQFTAEQNSTHPDIVKRINEQNGQMVDAIDNIRRDASPTTVGNDYIENGRAAVDALKAYDEPIKADIKAKYQALTDANGGSVPIDTGAAINNIDAKLKKSLLTKTASGNSAISEVMDHLRSGEPLDFEGFEAARSNLAEVMRGPDKSARTAAGIVRNELEQMPLTPQASKLKGLADDARAAAKSRFDALDADPAYKAAVDDAESGNARGSPTPLADTFLDKYALSKSAPKSNVDLMMQKIRAADPDAAGAVESYALNAVRKAAINPNGNVLPNGYNGALQKLGPKLDSLVQPETRDKLESLGRVITNAKVEPAGGKVNYSRSGVVIKDALQGAAEHALNAKTGGLFGLGKKALNLKENAFAKDALAPGAGLDSLKSK